MAKLASFLERLAEKAAAKEQAAGREGEPLEGSSLYAKRRYWDERYEDGVVGHTADKGELSNEWCGGTRDAKSRAVPHRVGVVLLACCCWAVLIGRCALRRFVGYDALRDLISRHLPRKGARQPASKAAPSSSASQPATKHIRASRPVASAPPPTPARPQRAC